MKNLLIVNNIPTPYRAFMYNILYKVGKYYNINTYVIFQSRREKHRYWNPDEIIINFPHHFSKIPFSNNYYDCFSRFTFNCDVLSAILNSKYDYIMFAPSMSITNWIGSLLPSANVTKILYSEANIISLKKNILPVRLFRSLIYSRFDISVCPGIRAFELVRYIAPLMINRPEITLPNIVNDDLFFNVGRKLRNRKDDLRKELGLQNENIIIISIGILPCKGTSIMLDAISEISGNYQVIYLGDGFNRKELISKSARLGILNRVLFLGQKSENDIVRYLAAADWFLHPALYDASPLACVEALCVGLPMAVSQQTGNSPEVVINGTNGYIFDSYNPIEILNTLKKLVNLDEKKRSAMSAKSIELSDKYFNPTNVANNFFMKLIECEKIK